MISSRFFNDKKLIVVSQLTYLRSNISATESDLNFLQVIDICIYDHPDKFF